MPMPVSFKFGTCVHILFTPKTRGNADLAGRESLAFRGVRKRSRRQTISRPPGRLANNGAVLSNIFAKLGIE
ncbi:hypothetical protein PHMEG_0007000 [Phytophthora megakarya]|uniref:Uncharacterized protein n=1 Tax=Phytophthora megakarya TaxID=4795 RepID=A0A225WNI9_9STRA|nr:hypothetical protein PHMEG_0007000 [Phytophthora megakarya]